MVKLTNDKVRTLPVKGADVLYPDDDTPNFYLRVREGGSRTFLIQWRQGPSQRRATIGKVGVYTVDEARKKARQMLVDIDKGMDPITQKAQARVDDRQLFGVMAAEYLEFRAKDMRASSLGSCRLHLQKYFTPLHRLPLHKINRATIAAELRTVAMDRGPVAANRGRSTLSAFFGWAIGEGVIEANPVINTNKSCEGRGRERVLTDDELVAVWNAAPASDYGRIIKLLILTGQRRDEIANLRWSEIVDGAIALPRERVKNNRAHVVPLSPQAKAVLDDCSAIVGREHRLRPGAGRLFRLCQGQEKAGRSLRRSGVGRARPAPHGGDPDGGSGRPASRYRGGPEPRLRPQGRRGRHLQQKQLCRGKARRPDAVGQSYQDPAGEGRRRERNQAARIGAGVRPDGSATFRIRP